MTDIYLAWLHKQVESLGVHFKARKVSSMDEVPDCDAVVVAAGLGSAALLGDGEVYPIRGLARTAGRPSSAGSSTPE